MNALFSEREADSEVIESLVRANRQKSSIIESLENQLKRSPIDMFIKSTEGKFYRVEAEQEVSAEDVQAALSHCQAEADALQALLAPAAPADNSAPADAPADPVAAPTDQSAANDAQPAPAAPEAPAQPTETEPTVDPNAAPAQPEQPQQAAQPDPNALPPLQ